MNMSSAHRCRQCDKPLALADQLCSACGQPVPAEDRRKALLARAEALAGTGQFMEAARSLEAALQSELEPDEARLLWRKRGVWLLRSQRPELLDAAEAALAESLRLDDSDDLSHQLWIDLLAKRGSLEKARAWYAQRLQLQPEDAMATRQLQVIRLSADFKTAPPPKLAIPDAKGQGILHKLLRPTRAKTAAAALGLLVNAALLLKVYFWPFQGVKGDPASGIEQMGSIILLLNDPWLPGIQAALCAAYLAFAGTLKDG
jgi:tetratricopeptide (TPR) repeat protein